MYTFVLCRLHSNLNYKFNANLCSGHSALPALLLQLVDPNPIRQTTHQYNECSIITDNMEVQCMFNTRFTTDAGKYWGIYNIHNSLL